MPEKVVIGDCELCGEWASHLVGGVCASCRDGFDLRPQQFLDLSLQMEKTMTTIRKTFDMIRSLKKASGIKVSRNFEGFFADRIVHAVTEPTLLDAIERLAKGLDASIEYVGGDRVAKFMEAAHAPDASAVLAWIRQHPRVAAMVAGMRNDEDYTNALSVIQITPIDAADDSVVTTQPEYAIKITARMLSPLAHGADNKAGNATLFRRRQTITETGRVLELPFYSGNAIRGQIRDLLADHLLSALGLTPRRDKPPVNIWFFHILYAGGVLEEQSKVMDAINKELGKSGSLRTDGLRRLRDMIPSLSTLGSAIGNRIIPGRVYVGDLRPCCREWGNGDMPAAQLMEWSFLTRREDYEGRTAEDNHTGMIANTEVLKAGTVLVGGLDIDGHASEIERAVIARGLQLLVQRGMLGAENRRGMGKAALTIEGAPDAAFYDAWLADNRGAIIEYLNEIGAIANASSSSDSGGD